jgi:hypothetical protein
MDTQTLYELIGYAASVLVAISLTMRSVLRLRIINLIGAVTFAIYGLLIGATPIALVNGVIVLINVYYLYGMLRSEEYFDLLAVAPDADYLQHFLRFYADDIRGLVPEFTCNPADTDIALLILRDMRPVGVFLAQYQGADQMFVQLDYVIPGYRDLKVARYLYDGHALTQGRGITRVYTQPGNPQHARYLRHMGFQFTPRGALVKLVG